MISDMMEEVYFIVSPCQTCLSLMQTLDLLITANRLLISVMSELESPPTISSLVVIVLVSSRFVLHLTSSHNSTLTDMLPTIMARQSRWKMLSVCMNKMVELAGNTQTTAPMLLLSPVLEFLLS